MIKTMSNYLKISALFLLTFCVSGLRAQTAADQASVLKMWDEVWHAYEADESKVWDYYADNACEVYPDGSHLCGKDALKAAYEAFKPMLDGKPSWTYMTPSVIFISPDVAMLIGDISTDMKLKGGQQIGGKMKFTAIVKKTNGRWLIAYDSQTPIIPMPGN